MPGSPMRRIDSWAYQDISGSLRVTLIKVMASGFARVNPFPSFSTFPGLIARAENTALMTLRGAERARALSLLLCRLW